MYSKKEVEYMLKELLGEVKDLWIGFPNPNWSVYEEGVVYGFDSCKQDVSNVIQKKIGELRE